MFQKTIEGRSNWDQREDGNAVIISKEELASLIQTAIRNLKTSDQVEVSVESKLIHFTSEIRGNLDINDIRLTRSHSGSLLKSQQNTYFSREASSSKVYTVDRN